jgi:hypothetical protein
MILVSLNWMSQNTLLDPRHYASKSAIRFRKRVREIALTMDWLEAFPRLVVPITKTCSNMERQFNCKNQLVICLVGSRKNEVLSLRVIKRNSIVQGA